MKRFFPRRTAAAVALYIIAVSSSCSSVRSALSLPSKESWSSRGRAAKGTVSLGSINVDSISLRNSLEREIAGMLPLLFLEKGYRVPEGTAENGGGEDSGENGADFTADVSLFEREYLEGWKTKRSVSVELRIWSAEQTALPLAAGRAMLSGGKSLASSETADKLLRLALSQALSSLEKKRK